MTLFDKLNKVQIAAMAFAIAVLAAGCHCGKSSSSGGSEYYTYTPAPYSSTTYSSTASSSSSGAAETKSEMETGTNMVIPLYEESLAVQTRQVEQGTVRLKKVVKTETVNQPVQIRRETVVIERGPASGQPSASMDNAFQEQEIVIQLWREEPVVETKIVPAGQIVAQRRFETEQTSVQRQVRKEAIDIDKSGDSQNVIISGDLSSSGAQGGGADSSSQSSGKAAGGTITEVTTITSASDPASLAQRNVHFSNVKVERIITDRVVEIQDDGGRPCFIRLNETMPNVKAGDLINVTGTARPIPASLSDLGQGDAVKQALQGQQIYVDAQKFEVTNR